MKLIELTQASAAMKITINFEHVVAIFEVFEILNDKFTHTEIFAGGVVYHVKESKKEIESLLSGGWEDAYVRRRGDR